MKTVALIAGMSRAAFTVALVAALLLVLPGLAAAHDPDHTDEFDRARCSFSSTGNNPYFPLWPGYIRTYEGEEEDEGEIVEIEATITVLTTTEIVDGVETRILEERESEDGELVEVSRNFFAVCRETGDVWYFGEDVDDYEEGEIVGHEGAWRAGMDGARPGILMPATPLIGARSFSEVAPGIAEDFFEVISLDEEITVPAGVFDHLLFIEEGSALDPEDFSEKWFAPGIGMVKDDELELVGVTPPPCVPDERTHCLNDGRFKVQADWTDFQGGEGDATAILGSADSGEFWFFAPNNTELIVKVLDACNLAGFNSYWVFAAGLTNVELTIEVTDTLTGQLEEYDNDSGVAFQPILDTSSFTTCP